MRLTSPVLMACAFAAAMSSSAARAADSGTEARLREALRSATAQVRALEDERAKWQASDAEQKEELESLRKQVAAVPKAPPPSRASARCLDDLQSCQVEQVEQAAATAKLKETIGECERAARDAAASAHAQDEKEQARIKAETAETALLTERAKACEAKNARMYQVAKEILAQLWKNGGGEPILGLKRVEVENFAQDAEDKLLEARVKP
jgi:hypothetical protein